MRPRKKKKRRDHNAWELYINVVPREVGNGSNNSGIFMGCTLPSVTN